MSVFCHDFFKMMIIYGVVIFFTFRDCHAVPNAYRVIRLNFRFYIHDAKYLKEKFSFTHAAYAAPGNEELVR